MSVLEQVGTEVAGVATQVGPRVVGLGRGWGRGSGVVVAPGRVLTCAHVLRGEEVAVRLGDEVLPGRVAGADADLDLAVIAVDTAAVEPVAWDPAAADSVSIGTPVVALADPGGRGLRASPGFVVAAPRTLRGSRGRRVRGVIEHSAPLPRGSSGGPLVDLQGRLLGLNAVRLEGGLILAIPAGAALKERIGALARGEATSPPRLGVAIAPAHIARRIRTAAGLAPHDGLLVRAVLDGSPAHRAGLRRGDLLVAAGERPLRELDDLLDALEPHPDALSLTVLRGAEEHAIEARFTN